MIFKGRDCVLDVLNWVEDHLKGAIVNAPGIGVRHPMKEIQNIFKFILNSFELSTKYMYDSYLILHYRSKGIFTKSNTRDYEDTSHVNCSATTYDDLDCTKHTDAIATSNRNCDIDEHISPVYDEVNESAKQ